MKAAHRLTSRLSAVNGATIRHAINGNDKMAAKAEKLAKRIVRAINADVHAEFIQRQSGKYLSKKFF